MRVINASSVIDVVVDAAQQHRLAPIGNAGID